MAATDDEIMAQFVRDYLALLDERVTTITTALLDGTDVEAHVALLSLESSSRMVGATELAKLVGLLRSDLDQGRRTNMPALLKAVAIEADRLPGRLVAPAL